MRNRHRRQRWTSSRTTRGRPGFGKPSLSVCREPPGLRAGGFHAFHVVPSQLLQVVSFLRVCGATRKCPPRPRPTWRLGDSRDHREVGHPGNRSAAQAPADRGRSRGVRRVSGVVLGARDRGLTPACWRFFFWPARKPSPMHRSGGLIRPALRQSSVVCEVDLCSHGSWPRHARSRRLSDMPAPDALPRSEHPESRSPPCGGLPLDSPLSRG